MSEESKDKRPPLPTIQWRWYSICSRHRDYDTECGLCQRGHWMSDYEREFSNWLWTYSKDIWQKWADKLVTEREEV